MKQTENLA